VYEIKGEFEDREEEGRGRDWYADSVVCGWW